MKRVNKKDVNDRKCFKYTKKALYPEQKMRYNKM